MRGQLVKRERSFTSTRRTVLLMSSGVLVMLYVLAPFCWLVLTSFMHERDALTVPTQWIPTDMTFENYVAFFNPTGTRAVVGSRAAEHGQLARRGRRDSNDQRSNRGSRRLQPGAHPVSRPGLAAFAIHRFANGPLHCAHRSALPDGQDFRFARQSLGAREHLSHLHAPVFDLASEDLFPEHPPRY